MDSRNPHRFTRDVKRGLMLESSELERWVHPIRCGTNLIELTQITGLMRRAKEQASGKQTEEIKRLADKRLVTVLRSITDGIVVLDKDWRYIYCNEQGARMLGMRPEKLLGACVWDLFPDSRSTQYYECFHRAVDTGQAVHMEEFCPLPNRWFECHCYPSEEGLFVSFQDVTERRCAQDDVQQLLIAARAEKEWLSLVLKSITDEVWFTDAQKRYKLANPSALREFGLSSVEGLSVEAVLATMVVLRADGSPRPIEEAPLLRALAGETVRNEEQIVVSPRAGQLRHRQVSSAPVRDVSGEIIGSVSVVRDVTERVLAEQALRASRLMLDAALSSMTDAVFITDAAGRFLEFNEAFASIHRFKNKGECARTFAEYPNFLDVFFPDGSRAPIEEWAVPRALRGEIGTNVEYGLRRKDTGETWIGSYSFGPIRDHEGSIVGSVVSGRDVTERNRIEAAARASAALEQARDAAVRDNEGKSRLLTAASHDLRQPLQTIELLNGTLRRLVTDPDAIEVLSHQDQAIDAMSRLLNALLDVSKLESGAINPESSHFAVAALFDELRMEFAGMAADKGLLLEIESCADGVYADPALVEQILRNLLSNAVKYTEQGRVRLRCRTEGALVRVDVIDTGVGIAPDQLPHIYDAFYQVGVPTNSTREGYGLGLSIVQRLVELLGVKLEVRSELSRGTTFSLFLPVSSQQQVTSDRAVAAAVIVGPRQIGAARLLLVEDNASVRRAMSRLLVLEGYRVTSVASLSEALQHVRAGNGIDLLICDYHLNGGETGTQVIAALRALLGISLRVLLTTGDTSSAIKQLPRDPYLRFTSKPIKAEELLALLRALLAT
jgi:two-component system, sensor histidine kinase